MEKIVVIGILLVISFLFKAVMDMSAKDYFSNPFWNKTQSWQNKYAFPLIRNYKHWYYFDLIKPIYKERFPFSATALVFVTDGWHLAQFFFLNCLFLSMAVMMGNIIITFVAIRIAYSIVFNLIYE
jgi:hypothetical protein